MKEKIPTFNIPNNNFFDANHVNLTFSVPLNAPNNNFFDASHVNLTFSVPPAPPKQILDQQSKSS